jgi:hypothetical protein
MSQVVALRRFLLPDCTGFASRLRRSAADPSVLWAKGDGCLLPKFDLYQ